MSNFTVVFYKKENGIEPEFKQEHTRHKAYRQILNVMKEASEKANMTQRQPSEATGIVQGEIRKIERGLKNPAYDTIIRLNIRSKANSKGLYRIT